VRHQAIDEAPSDEDFSVWQQRCRITSAGDVETAVMLQLGPEAGVGVGVGVGVGAGVGVGVGVDVGVGSGVVPAS
jgi:hypothetical protein